MLIMLALPASRRAKAVTPSAESVGPKFPRPFNPSARREEPNVITCLLSSTTSPIHSQQIPQAPRL